MFHFKSHSYWPSVPASHNIPEIFDLSRVTWNLSVSGHTGGGKTTLVQDMILQEFFNLKDNQHRPKVVIFSDPRFSYKKLMNILGGNILLVDENYTSNIFDLTEITRLPTEDYFEKIFAFFFGQGQNKLALERIIKGYYTQNKLITDASLKRYFNEHFPLAFEKNSPASLKELLTLGAGSCMPTADKIKEIINFIESLIDYQYSETERSIVEIAITKAYNNLKDRYPTLSDLYKELCDLVKTKEAYPCLFRISDWIKGGSHPEFDTDKISALTNNINIIHIDEVNPKVAKALQILVRSEVNRFLSNPECLNLEVYDETPFFNPYSAGIFKDHLIHNLKTSRRNNKAIILVTQLISDLDRPSQSRENVGEYIDRFICCKIIGDELIDSYTKFFNVPKSTFTTLGIISKFDKKNNSLLRKETKFVVLSERQLDFKEVKSKPQKQAVI